MLGHKPSGMVVCNLKLYDLHFLPNTGRGRPQIAIFPDLGDDFLRFSVKGGLGRITVAIWYLCDMHAVYMRRCLELASLGLGTVAPNPAVGCVLVHNGFVIGEGWHHRFGGHHAEVEALGSVPDSLHPLIAESTVYVSLEPCSHFGKTPPCVDLLLRHQVKRVVIASLDPNPLVAGSGVKRLEAAGVEVIVGVLEEEAKQLNAAFFTYHTLKRPYITLKWAESADGFIGSLDGHPLHLSNEQTDMFVHKLRAEHSAILVGGRTALADNPRLTNRLWTGKNPLRVIIDTHGDLPDSLRVFDGEAETLVCTTHQQASYPHARMVVLQSDVALVPQVIAALYQQGVQSVLVEGGAKTLSAFLEAGAWDQVYRIQTPQTPGSGVRMPVDEVLDSLDYTYRQIGDNRILHAENPHGSFAV